MIELDIRIYVNEHYITENMLGNLSTWVLSKDRNDIVKTVNLYWIFALLLHLVSLLTHC